MRARITLLVLAICTPPMLSLAACSEGSTGPDNVITVNIVDNEFLPPSITVAAGTTVRWRNNGNQIHNVTSIPAGTWNTLTIVPGLTGQNTFNTAGTFQYQCTFHNDQRGTIIVQ
jgi:plastocyanin